MNTFGRAFRVTTFGESHGAGLGAVVDGCPAGLKFGEADLQQELDRRRPGQSALTTARSEADQAEILSGVFEGRTTGAPIAILVRNTDADSSAYRPSKTSRAPAMPIMSTRPSTGTGTTGAGVVPRAGRRSAGLPPAP